jgi:hypothetical protein
MNSDSATHCEAAEMDARLIVTHSGYETYFKFKNRGGVEFAPINIPEKYNLLGIINLVLETTPSGILTMAPSTPQKTSTSVGNFPLKEKQNIPFWGFTPGAEILNGRLAMLGFVTALLLEFFSGQGVLHFLHLL